MKRNLTRIAIFLAAAVLLLALLGLVFVKECDSTGGMGWRVVECQCGGYEWLLYDRTEADGPKRSLCLGRIRERQCFEYIGGPPVDCRELEAR